MLKKILHLFYPSINNLTDEQLRIYKYVRTVYLIGMIYGPFYLLKYNYEYHIDRYNFPVGLTIILAVFWPRIFRRTNNLAIITGGIWILYSLMILILLYSSGGLKAPGIFWVIVIPITGATIFGQRGIYAGSILCLAYILIMRQFELSNQIPLDVFKTFDFEKEKFINLLTFSVYFVLTIRHYVNSESILYRRLSDSRSDTESLLRILIHDVANPIGVILLSMDTLKKNQVKQPEFDKRVFDRIDRATATVIGILEKIRQIKALGDGKAKLELQPVDIIAILNNVINLNHHRLETKQLEVTLSHDKKEIFVLADEVILTIVVFTNLLTNAIKFSDPKSRIEIAVEILHQTCVVKFQDHGVGIPPHIMNVLFELNQATSRTGTAGETGTGYGMPLIKEYLTKMNGSIQVDSTQRTVGTEATSGTTFTLRIPLVAGNRSRRLQ